MTPVAQGIEVVWVTPADLLVGFLVWLALIGVAFAAGAWAMRSSGQAPVTPVDGARVDDGSVDPKPGRGQGRRRQPHTGVVHAECHLSESTTVWIRPSDGAQR